MSDPFANSHEYLRRKAEHEAREAAAGTTKQQAQQRIKANEARREALARPDPAYKTKFPMFDR